MVATSSPLMATICCPCRPRMAMCSEGSHESASSMFCVKTMRPEAPPWMPLSEPQVAGATVCTTTGSGGRDLKDLGSERKGTFDECLLPLGLLQADLLHLRSRLCISQLGLGGRESKANGAKELSGTLARMVTFTGIRLCKSLKAREASEHTTPAHAPVGHQCLSSAAVMRQETHTLLVKPRTWHFANPG